MDRGLFIAASGMLAEQVRQDQLANDLANATTPGYKADRATQSSFGELLLADRRTGRAIGTLGAGVRITGQTTDFRPSDMRATNEPLDLAVQGEGWFAVRTDQGERYTRNGRFTVLADRTLGDAQGNQVLGPNRQPVRVTPQGTVDPADVGVFDVQGLAKQGENLFTGQAGGRGTGRVLTGTLEASGVTPARTMVDMMASMRAFEAGQRAVTTIDDTLKLAASQVGGLPG
ncbi:flagellar hook-basal body protein [Conexibacter sp. SYSU D00693]|uniref:flagellar hook-basal body protein n=1 Tax=Conexibacter sp. SYSU D00693 TaxID=2812560 RepID=UPI00196AD95D|nr:flagellar hook-basal body protein [Conexibacter sp. SYSU D00693]